MDDLQNYRIKIGLFLHRHTTSLILSKQVKTQKLAGILIYSLLAIALTGFTIHHLVIDPSIESNPGPKIKYSSPEEELELSPTIADIKKDNKDIAVLSSHRFFLQSCIDLRLQPRGLDNKLSLAAAKANDSLREKLAKVDRKNVEERMKLIVEHYTIELANYVASRDKHLSDLQHRCSSTRFAELNKQISSSFIELVESLQREKVRKINSLLNLTDSSNDNEAKPWMPELNLTSVEKNFIETNQQLCDGIINASSTLIMN